MFRHLAAASSLTLLAALPAPAQSSVRLTPTHDNSIYQFDPGASNGAGTRLFCGNDLAQTSKRGLLRFDVAAALPAGAIVLSARLEMTVVQTIAPNLPVAVHRVTSAWGEGTSVGISGQGGGAPATAGDATWSHAIWPHTSWQTPGGDFVTTASASTVCSSSGRFAWSSAQLTADVQAWADGTAADHGWIVISQETGAQTARAFATREATPAANRPELVLTWAPRAAVSSFGSGCTGGGPQPLSLSANGLPTVPNPTLALSLSGGPTNGLWILDYFGALLPNPVPLGQGCDLWGDVGLLLDGVSTNGTAPLAIPNDPGLLGAVLGVQGFSVDPATFAIAASNALELRVGR